MHALSGSEGWQRAAFMRNGKDSLMIDPVEGSDEQKYLINVGEWLAIAFCGLLRGRWSV